MTTWTDTDILRLDAAYAKADVPFHARPLQAAMDILGTNFILGVGASPEVHAITEAYRRLVPEVDSTWPGLGIGIAASIDRVRKVTVAIAFGGNNRITTAQALGFTTHAEYVTWCRDDPEVDRRCTFAFADIYDFSYGVDDIRGTTPAVELWKLAMSNLEDVANALPSSFSVDSVLQPICLTAELSMKACLIHCGTDAKELAAKAVGHRHTILAQRMTSIRPHRDDADIATVAAHLPDYVGSRYKSAGLSRLDVVNLALGSQFIAASAVRRLTNRDLAQEVEKTDLRPPFF